MVCFVYAYHKGYLNKSNKFLKDNQSAMRMEVNGSNSSTGNLWHIEIRYFFDKDQAVGGEISIV